MTRPSSRFPTELELEILKVLWRDGPSTVRHVRDSLTGFRDLAHTSVMTIMNIMTGKKYLKRKRNGKVYIYTPAVTEVETSRGMLGDLVDRVFGGSASAVVLHLLETKGVEGEELDSLRRLIEERAKEEQA